MVSKHEVKTDVNAIKVTIEKYLHHVLNCVIFLTFENVLHLFQIHENYKPNDNLDDGKRAWFRAFTEFLVEKAATSSKLG